jgi:hypothetical protein
MCGRAGAQAQTEYLPALAPIRPRMRRLIRSSNMAEQPIIQAGICGGNLRANSLPVYGGRRRIGAWCEFLWLCHHHERREVFPSPPSRFQRGIHPIIVTLISVHHPSSRTCTTLLLHSSLKSRLSNRSRFPCHQTCGSRKSSLQVLVGSYDLGALGALSLSV